MSFAQSTLNLNDSGVAVMMSGYVKDKIGVWLFACKTRVTSLIWLSGKSKWCIPQRKKTELMIKFVAVDSLTLDGVIFASDR